MKPEMIKEFALVETALVTEENAVLWRSAYMSSPVTALVMTDEYNEPLMTITTNLEGYGEFPRDSNHVFIKNYSENEGILEFLVQEKVVSKPKRSVNCGHTVAHECEMLI